MNLKVHSLVILKNMSVTMMLHMNMKKIWRSIMVTVMTRGSDTIIQSACLTRWLIFYSLWPYKPPIVFLMEWFLIYLNLWKPSYLFWQVLGHCVPDIAKAFPSSLYMARKVMYEKIKITRYVVCRKCFSIYKFKDCIEGSGRSIKSKLCPHRRFPHPFPRFRACQCVILKSVELAGRKTILYPYLTYCYLGLDISIQNLMCRANYDTLCEHWRTNVRSDCYKDVYDGKIWQDFQNLWRVPIFIWTIKSRTNAKYGLFFNPSSI